MILVQSGEQTALSDHTSMHLITKRFETEDSHYIIINLSSCSKAKQSKNIQQLTHNVLAIGARIKNGSFPK